MSECPMHKLRADLPPLTERIAKLPIDERGYPVPAFVQWIVKEGNEVRPASPDEPGAYPDFRIVDPAHMLKCVKEHTCWVCGEKLGVHRAYVIGPMCAINRNSAEPPSHVECAEWSVKGCPFLSRPNMKRREDELTEMSKENVAGHMVPDNPGVTLIWHVRNHLKMSHDGKGGVLFDVGKPEKVTFWKEGRLATNEEAIEGVNGSVERLLALCDEPADRNEVKRLRDEFVDNIRRGA
jgi:hypothetical protein